MVNLSFTYDRGALAFLTWQERKPESKRRLEALIRESLKEFFHHKPGLAVREIRFRFGKGDYFSRVQEKSTKELVVIQVDLERLADRTGGLNIRQALSENLPPERWVLFRTWYGRGKTFFSMLEHELRHHIDDLWDELRARKQQMAFHERHESRLAYQLKTFIGQLRTEAYAQLFDFRGPLAIDTGRLVRLRQHLLEWIEGKEPRGELARSQEVYGLPVGLLSPGDHHYFLSRFMAFMIAYARLPEYARVVPGLLERGESLPPLSRQTLEEAGELIRHVSDVGFLKLFDKAAATLHLQERYVPFSFALYRQILYAKAHKEKMRAEKAHALWKKGKITFEELLNAGGDE